MQKQLGSKLFIIFLLCSLALLLGLFWAYVSAIVMALLIASVFYPVFLWVKRLLKDREIAASLFMSLFILLVTDGSRTTIRPVAILLPRAIMISAVDPSNKHEYTLYGWVHALIWHGT